MKSSEGLQMSGWRTWHDLSLLRFNESVRKENVVVVEAPSSLQSVMPVGHVSLGGESAETVTIFCIDVARKVLQKIMNYDQKKRSKSCG